MFSGTSPHSFQRHHRHHLQTPSPNTNSTTELAKTKVLSSKPTPNVRIFSPAARIPPKRISTSGKLSSLKQLQTQNSVEPFRHIPAKYSEPLSYSIFRITIQTRCHDRSRQSHILECSASYTEGIISRRCCWNRIGHGTCYLLRFCGRLLTVNSGLFSTRQHTGGCYHQP